MFISPDRSQVDCGGEVAVKRLDIKTSDEPKRQQQAIKKLSELGNFVEMPSQSDDSKTDVICDWA